MDLYSSGVTIGEVARRTGVGISTLRAWERRYGFPAAQRLPSGHRRYSERDIDAINGVVRDRRGGATLESALGRALERLGAQRSSLFATLRHALPNVAPAVLTKGTMLAISRAIEDEASARADSPVLLGAFQHARFWQASAPRWRQLAPSATATAVMADFRQSRRRGAIFEIAVPAAAPVLREWAIVCDSPTFSACLVGIEQLQPTGRHAARRFEALWTVEPLAVREVARVGCGIAATRDPALAIELGQHLDVPARATYDTIRVATSLTNRIVATLDSA